MSMHANDPLLALSRGNAERAIQALVGPDATDRQLVHGLYRWAETAGLDAAIVVTQAYHETANLTSGRWLNDRNPAGIGIPADDTSQPFPIPDGDAAARLQIQCLYALAMKRLHPDIPLWPEATAWMRTVWLDQKVSDPDCPLVAALADLNRRYVDRNGEPQATWAWDANYHTKLVQRGNAIYGASLAPAEGSNSMSFPLPPAPPVEIAITPANNPNRPKLDMPTPGFITVHEVGNQSPGADENMHRAFVHNGGGPNQVSFHFVVGPGKVIQLIPLDEVAWHASDGFFGPGNRNSVAIETIQIGDFDRSLSHLAWLIAELVRNPDRFFANHSRAWDFSEERIRQHHDWAPDNKNCPEFMRDRGLWPVLLQRIERELRERDGARPLGAAPLMPDFLTDEELSRGIDRTIGNTKVFACRRLWTATQETPRLQHTGPGAPEIGPPIPQGATFGGEFVFRSHGDWWVLTRWGTRVKMADLEPQVTVS